MLITKNSPLLQIIAFYDFGYFVSVVSRQFISFVTKMEVYYSRKNHEFTTCVHELTACLGQNRFRDHGEHEFTIAMECITAQTCCSLTLADSQTFYQRYVFNGRTHSLQTRKYDVSMTSLVAKNIYLLYWYNTCFLLNISCNFCENLNSCQRYKTKREWMFFQCLVVKLFFCLLAFM